LRELVSARSAACCASLVVTGDFPAMPLTCQLVPTANRKTHPLAKRPEPA
jgi:hypothetical protein